ncbi:uncharacterized protein LJ206_020686 [Theristicus caerulescens]
MGTPEATGAIVPPEVSPELLQPLVTVVATLGELGGTTGDVPLAGPLGSLWAGLVALSGKIRGAMEHSSGEATCLRHALATAGATRATPGATPEPAVVPPGDPAVPRATAGDPWATVATITRRWREAVASVATTWEGVVEDATRLKEACGTVATAEAAAGAITGHLAALVAQDRAHQQLLEATRALPVASELDTAASEVAAHEARVAEASAGLQAATEATEKAVVAMVETVAARERGRLAAVACEPLGRLVAACHGATRFYGHLRHLLEDIEATVATMAAGRSGPEGAAGGPEAPGVAQEGPGGPKHLLAAVAVAEVLWEASARLAQRHLLKTLLVARRLLATCTVPDATTAATVAQRCRDATAALPGLLP